jgi:transposase-like protein
MVLEHGADHASQWAAIGSIAAKIGCTGETLRGWMRQAERDQGLRAGPTSDGRERIKLLERENCELRQANEIESIQNRGGLKGARARFWAHGDRVDLVAELRPGVMMETEVARIEHDEQAGLADLGLRLAETKQITAALQAEIVPAQVDVIGELRCGCSSCGHRLASKGRYRATFRSLFDDVPVRVRRLLACRCQGQGEAESFAVLDLGYDAVAPELAYVTARYAALAPFGKVAALLSELLPMSGAQNAGTVRNRTRRVGETVVRQHATETAKQTVTPPAGPVVVGLDGGYVRSRHRQEDRHFEVIAGKVIDAGGSQHRSPSPATAKPPRPKRWRRRSPRLA